jgi:glycosyltransferase involved in cell wall biosynthesis
LVLIGKDTRVFWDLASKADIKNAQNCIYTPGYIQEADLPTLYSLSLLTVYPSSYEGFGFPLLESMASGRVVCCSDIPVFREIGGDVPVYFDQTNVEDIAQKLLATLTDTHDREDRALAGRTRARAYVDVSNRATFLKIVNSNHV